MVQSVHLDNHGLISGRNYCSVNAKEQIDNFRMITSRQKLEVTTKSLANDGKIIASGIYDIQNNACDLNINAAEKLNNGKNGLIASKSKLQLTAGDIANIGRLESRAYLTVNANLLENSSNISCPGEMKVNAEELVNTETGDICIGDSFVANSKKLKNNGNIDVDSNIIYRSMGRYTIPKPLLVMTKFQ